ncbi:hypothetical protein PGT21_001124 [Puccinia graminis f. sp. tritici]|uniref:Uncharacterized protein n=1 Tax=Puccinia graminis f. sp. tritici TaxID=56615 RepID=A0A5B0QLY5_PUCGR|nr:hypothetical protein PGT21_001124 [Puccinia graminis f. sp. tritici]
MTQKRIRIHRSLESHQRKLTQERNRNIHNRRPAATVNEPLAPIQEESHDSESVHAPIEDKMEDPTNGDDGLQEENENLARQLRRALDLISRMNPNDFFDPTEARGADGLNAYDRMDWLFEEMDAEQMAEAEGDEEDAEPDQPQEDEWYPFKNKMAS